MEITTKNSLIQPVVKWIGGKRQLLPEIQKILPSKKLKEEFNYVEPFLGGGALLFSLQPVNAIINDINTELINVYSTIKNNLNELIFDLSKHKNTSDYYYEIRDVDRDAEKFSTLSNVERASRILYLNKTCFNGLYRVNNLGQYNASFADNKNPNIVNSLTLRAVSEYLNVNNISIMNKSYSEILIDVINNKNNSRENFIYLDPPYYPLKEGSDFTKYTSGGWSEKDHYDLFLKCRELNENGIKFIMSNSSAEYIKDMYKEFKQIEISANRMVNPNASDRKGKIIELLIYNY
jgi:DNA adenine methylase